MAGIVGYGAYVPRFRIKTTEISRQWGTDGEVYRRGLMVEEKSVPGHDQDTISMSVEATRHALARAGATGKIGAVYVGSESHPYAVKPSGVTVSEAFGLNPNVHTADFEFACKAGTEAMFLALQLVENGMERALAIGADTAQGAPGDPLEYSASAAAAAFLMGRDDVVAECEFTHTYMTDTPDFWRRDLQHYPQHGGRFTGEPAYFKHVVNCGREMMAKAGAEPGDFRYCVFHQPNGKFPTKAGKMLGFGKEQITTGLVAPKIGNPYSASSPVGLTAILDEAKPGDRIFMVSYGSGAGSDGFIWKVTDRIEAVRDVAPKTWDIINHAPRYLSYGEYTKYRRKIIMNATIA